MVNNGNCPRCKSTLYKEKANGGADVYCINCGYRETLEDIPMGYFDLLGAIINKEKKYRTKRQKNVKGLLI